MFDSPENLKFSRLIRVIRLVFLLLVLPHYSNWFFQSDFLSHQFIV